MSSPSTPNASGTPRLGIRVPPCAPATEVVEVVRKAERHGFDVWMPDSQLLWRDVWSVLAVAAVRTEHVRLGVMVTNLETRDLSVTAGAIRTVAELAPGRLVVGIGAGNSSVRPLGLSPTGTKTLESGLTRLRALLNGERVDLGAGPIELRDAPGRVPLYLSATGPRNLALGGALADGVILLSGTSRSGFERARRLVAEGAQAAGRTLDDVTLAVSGHCHITDDPARDAAILSPFAAQIATDGGRKALEAEGVEIGDLPADGFDVHPDLIHAESWDQAVAAVRPYVSAEAARRFAERFGLVGDEDHVRGQIDRLRTEGADEVIVQHVGSYTMPEALMERLAPNRS